MPNIIGGQLLQQRDLIGKHQLTLRYCADSEGHLRTEIIEEVMSISDGQIVLREVASDAGLPAIDAAASLSRMGTRAYYPALQNFGPDVRHASPTWCRRELSLLSLSVLELAILSHLSPS